MSTDIDAFIVDEARFCAGHMDTGIYVRAKRVFPSGVSEWGSFDIVVLQRESILLWLRSRPGTAEKVVLGLLGYE